MNHSFQPGPPLPVPPPYMRSVAPPAPTYTLQFIQQPERAKVVSKGKEKDRKPVDPPPIIQLSVDHETSPCSFAHSPYLFASATLYNESLDEPKEIPASEGSGTQLLAGATVSSLHRLKDLNNNVGAFFVFGDISVGLQGKARIHFTLYDLQPATSQDPPRAVPLATVTSSVFEVASAKDWDGVKESTVLSRCFSDQGVRLRLRKESRNQARSRSFQQTPSSSTSTALHTPLAPQPPGRQDNYGSPSDERDSKRRKGYSMDYGPLSSSNSSYQHSPQQGYGSQGYGGHNSGSYASGYNQQQYSHGQQYADPRQQHGYEAMGQQYAQQYGQNQYGGYSGYQYPAYSSADQQSHGNYQLPSRPSYSQGSLVLPGLSGLQSQQPATPVSRQPATLPPISSAAGSLQSQGYEAQTASSRSHDPSSGSNRYHHPQPSADYYNQEIPDYHPPRPTNYDARDDSGCDYYNQIPETARRSALHWDYVTVRSSPPIGGDSYQLAPMQQTGHSSIYDPKR